MPKQNSQPNQQPPSSAVPIVPQQPIAASNPPQHSAPITGPNRQQATEQLVSVRSLPPLTTERDWVDYSGIGLTLVLFAVAIVQIVLLNRTLSATTRAANAASDNATAAKDNAAAARDAADETKRQNELIEGQSTEMKASIAEATRAAKAMESIAQSMAQSAASVQTSLAISREIADAQKLTIVLQNRAYLQTEDWKVFRLMDEFPGEPQYFGERNANVRCFIRNKGQTSATLRRIRVAIPSAGVTIESDQDLILEAQHWVERGISFEIPDKPEAASAFYISDLTVKVEVTYSDGFGTRTKRFCRTTTDHSTALLSGDNKAEQRWFVTGGVALNDETVHNDEGETSSTEAKKGRPNDES